MSKCTNCPRNCMVDRSKDIGFCKAGAEIKAALASVHNFEEPCISGVNGSGTIFFTGCNLKCVYCQNHKISDEMYGIEISIEKLADVMLKMQDMGVHNINLVTPTIYVTSIIEAIKLARKKGLNIPIIYNTSGYESVEVIKSLEPYIDIYLPDFKYADNELAYKYSNVKDYFENVTKALIEMKRQKKDTFNKYNILTSGVIVRHMILPNNTKNSKEVIKWIKDNLGEDTIISIMAQYFPTHKACNYHKINRKITKEELEEVENFLFEQNMINGYIQELGEHEEEYVPDFNLENLI